MLMLSKEKTWPRENGSFSSRKAYKSFDHFTGKSMTGQWQARPKVDLDC